MNDASFPGVLNVRRFAMARAVFALILREMSTTYGRSPGGYVWAIAEPLGAVAILSVTFSLITRHPPLGHNFVLFYASGFLPLAAYQNISGKIAAAIRFSRPLLAYPTVTYVDAIVARILLSILTDLLVSVILFGVTLTVIRDSVSLDYIALLRCIGMVVVFATGIGLVNCFLTSVLPIWQFVWAVISRPMFLVSGVMFLIDDMPAQIRDYLLYLPMTHFISMSRAGFYSSYQAVYVSEAYVYGVSLVLIAFGMLMLHRFHRNMMNEWG